MALLKILHIPFLLIVGFGLIVAYLKYVEKHSVFFPSKELEYSPKEAGLDFEEVSFKTIDNVEINAWFIPAKEAKKTILFTHGNAGNISHRVEKIKFFNELGCDVFIFDYRGYGKSKGKPSEKGIYLDTVAAYNYLLSRRVPATQIIGYGESLGGAAIIDLAAQKKMSGLIIDSAFSSAKDLVKLFYPFVPYWIFSSRFDSLEKIKNIKIPKLIIHSLNDEIIPYKLGQKLYDNAASPKELLQIHGGHNSCFFESENILRDEIKSFLNGLT